MTLDFSNDCVLLPPDFVCPHCTRPGREGQHRNCPKRPVAPPLPPLHKRLANFAVAAIGHALAGLPTCTQEEIDERLAICHQCELYLPDRDNPTIGHCTHPDCGCSITNLQGFVKKLAWADQSCPLGKWLKISSK